jgi:hypothetical protein
MLGLSQLQEFPRTIRPAGWRVKTFANAAEQIASLPGFIDGLIAEARANWQFALRFSNRLPLCADIAGNQRHGDAVTVFRRDGI